MYTLLGQNPLLDQFLLLLTGCYNSRWVSRVARPGGKDQATGGRVTHNANITASDTVCRRQVREAYHLLLI